MTSAKPSAPKRCMLSIAGHNVNVVQRLKGGNDRDNRPEPASVLSIEGCIITVDIDGVLYRYRNHDPEPLEATLESKGNHVEVQRRWSLL